ncbi:MAG TPA: SOS response-associated peptidase [Planctomycetota bacterium]|nr:SOS response-associated peptidase [Planctomycetota bacterium]
MCNRVTLREVPHDVARILELFNIPPLAARFNIAPTEDLLIFRRKGTQYEACHAHWGLQPRWMKDSRDATLFNARSETLDTKPAFREAFFERRCLIPVDGFYEWETRGRRKLPHHFTLKHARPFALAGLYESSEAEPEKLSCTIITVDSNDLLRPFNERMPAILDEDSFKTWLDPEERDAASLKTLLKTYDAQKMTSRRVNPYVNKSGNEGPQCLEEPAPEPPQMVQGTLFE